MKNFNKFRYKNQKFRHKNQKIWKIWTKSIMNELILWNPVDFEWMYYAAVQDGWRWRNRERRELRRLRWESWAIDWLADGFRCSVRGLAGRKCCCRDVGRCCCRSTRDNETWINSIIENITRNCFLKWIEYK